MKKTLCVASIFLIACFIGCKKDTTPPITIGTHVNTLIEQMGYPDETTKAPSGNRLLVYREIETVVRTKRIYVSGETSNQKGRMVDTPYTAERQRVKFFEIDDNGYIVNTSCRGC